MSSGNNIVILSDDTNARDILVSKINLVRNSDTLESYTYSNLNTILNQRPPELIILYSDLYNSNGLDAVETLKSTNNFSQIPILLVCEKVERNFILNAFDEGITDYILLNSLEAEFLIRIIWCLQKSSLIRKAQQNIQQLIDLDVIYKDTFFYKEKFVDTLFQPIIKKQLELGKNVSLMIVTPDIDCIQKLSPMLMGNILKGLIRKTDTVGIKDDNKFYILLSDTTSSQAEGFFKRLKEEFTDEYGICAGVTDITSTDITDFEVQAKTALQNALAKKGQIVIYEDFEKKKKKFFGDESDDMTVPHKNFKLFKQSFLKKLNGVIAPTFYQFQKVYEYKLFETEIEQITTEGKSTFVLKAPNICSTLSITYPGFSKINIKIEHKTSRANQEDSISLNISDLDNSKMTKILEDFINEYREISDN